MATEKRLIDANALAKNGWHLVKTGESNEFLASMSLADAPTIDAVEVVHGRWVRCKDWDYDYECSVCEGYAVENKDGNYDILTHYCPNCGAKMDEPQKGE